MSLSSCGLIVEYNPLHNGHLYHIKKAREETQADCLVAVMSGNFLQRGEPAILDKWKRAEIALLAGADLVIELPFASAVQSADYFAHGSIQILQALNVDFLCFGTDSKEKLDYATFGLTHKIYESQINQKYQEMKNNGMSYPQQMTTIYREIIPNWPLDFSSPNHILGMSYAKENAKYKQPMTLFPIKRQGSGYHDETVNKTEFSSATSIRKIMLEDTKRINEIKSSVPPHTYHQLSTSRLASWDVAWPYLKYAILTLSYQELANIYQMTEGIEYRIKDCAKKATSFSQFVELVKTKRYTWTRIQRLATYILNHISLENIKKNKENPYIRVLGFNDMGRSYLRQEKKQCLYPIITKIDRKNEESASLDIKVGEVYNLITGSKDPQDYYRSPIYVKGERV